MKKHERAWRTEVPEPLHDEFLAVIERLGLSQKSATARLMGWFVKQDPDVQALVMQQLTPERSQMLAKLILRNMGKGK